MSYTVQTQQYFQAAYAGAMAGFAFGGRYPLQSNPEDSETTLATTAANAFAYAEAVDTLIGEQEVVIDFLVILILESSTETFRGRSADKTLIVDDFVRLANAVVGAYEAAVAQASSQGVTLD